MEVASARARLVDFADEGASPALATIPRSEVEEAARYEDNAPELILDVTRLADGAERKGQVSVALDRGDLEEILRRAEGDSVTLAFDPDGLLTAFDPDVEGHGLKEVAAVIAVAVAAGTTAGYAYAQPAEGTSLGGATTIEQVRSDAAGAPVGAGIEAVRSAAEATTPVSADIEAVRLASAETIAASAPAPVGADIEAVRLASAETIAESSPSPAVGDIEAARSAAATSALTAAENVEAARSTEIAASAASGQSAVDIEAVRSAAADATRAAADTGGGISVSLPSPAVTGALGGAVALLITGAAFAATRRQQGARPA